MIVCDSRVYVCACAIDWLFYFTRIVGVPSCAVLYTDLYYVFARVCVRWLQSVRELARDIGCDVTHMGRYSNSVHARVRKGWVRGRGRNSPHVCIRMDCWDKSDRTLIGQWQNGTNCNFCRENVVKVYRIRSIRLRVKKTRAIFARMHTPPCIQYQRQYLEFTEY